MKKFIFMFFVAIVLSGCASAPTNEQIASAYYGEPISQSDAEALAKAFIDRTIEDNYSAVWQCRPIGKGYARDSLLYGGAGYYGWRMDCQINAKNSYGEQVRHKNYVFIFLDGGIKAAWRELVPPVGANFMEKLL